MQEIGIESSVLANILDGSKTIEGRLGKPKFLKFRVGDHISLREDVWQHGQLVKSIPDRAIIRIKQLLYFESFEEMLMSVNFKRVIPDAEDVQDAIATYYNFYTEEEEDEYGVVAIEFTLEETSPQ